MPALRPATAALLLLLLALCDQVRHAAAEKGAPSSSGGGATVTRERQEDKHREEDEADREHRQVSRRSFEVEVKADEVEIEGKVKDGKVKDAVKFALKTREDDGVRIRFEHKSKAEDSASENLRFVVNVLELFEYRPPAGAVGDALAFVPDGSMAQRVVRTWPLTKAAATWSAFTDDATTVPGVRRFETTATAADGARLVVRAALTEADTTLAGVALDPNSLKVDIEVHGWKYLSTDNTTRLALKTAVKSVHRERHDDDAAARQEGEKGGQFRFSATEAAQLPAGRFRWAEQVTLTGQTVAPVRAVVAQGSGDSEFRSWNNIYFSFLTPAGQAQPADIVWDPQLGLDYSTLNQGSNVGLIVGLVVGGVALVALAAVAVVMVRRRSQQGAAAGGNQQELAARLA